MNSKGNYELPEFATHWAKELGSSEMSLVRLQGGINNRVFCCGDAPNQFVIKGYSPLEPNQRDRMQAEVDFLHYSAETATGFTPKLIHSDPELRCVVLEYLDGISFPEGVSPPKEAVDTAVEFFRRLNEDPEAAKRSIHIDASEGFLSLTEHLNNVHRRIEGMECNHLPPDAKPEAERLLAILQSELDRIHEITANRISSGVIVDLISPDSRCVSPSDFGFHNAIQTSTGVRFYDFEFAGWDDPAKTIVDFILQPSVPIPAEHSILLIGLHPNERRDLHMRYRVLKPILRVKWVCIMLSFLRPERLEQLLLVIPEMNTSKLIYKRFRRVSNYLDEILQDLKI